MFPVESLSGDGFTYHTFTGAIARSAESAYREKRILAHALLVYDLKHAHMVKVLRSREYYEALNSLAGKWINIYHAPAERKKTIRPIVKKSGPSDSFMGYMIPGDTSIYDEGYTDTIEQLSVRYKLRNTERYPVLMFFRVEENEVVDSYGFTIKAHTSEDTYEQLVDVFSEVIRAVQEIDPSSVNNRGPIFELQKENLKYLQFERLAKKIPLSSFLSFLKVGLK